MTTHPDDTYGVRIPVRYWPLRALEMCLPLVGRERLNYVHVTPPLADGSGVRLVAADGHLLMVAKAMLKVAEPKDGTRNTQVGTAVWPFPEHGLMVPRSILPHGPDDETPMPFPMPFHRDFREDGDGDKAAILYDASRDRVAVEVGGVRTSAVMGSTKAADYAGPIANYIDRVNAPADVNDFSAELMARVWRALALYIGNSDLDHSRTTLTMRETETGHPHILATVRLPNAPAAHVVLMGLKPRSKA